MPKQPLQKQPCKEEEEEEFEVNRIFGSRKVKGKVEYKVLWMDKSVTWEPLDNLQNCLECVDDFKKRRYQGTLQDDHPKKILKIQQVGHKLKCIILWAKAGKGWIPFDTMKERHPKLLLQYLKTFECVQQLL